MTWRIPFCLGVDTFHFLNVSLPRDVFRFSDWLGCCSSTPTSLLLPWNVPHLNQRPRTLQGTLTPVHPVVAGIQESRSGEPPVSPCCWTWGIYMQVGSKIVRGGTPISCWGLAPTNHRDTRKVAWFHHWEGWDLGSKHVSSAPKQWLINLQHNLKDLFALVDRKGSRFQDYLVLSMTFSLGVPLCFWFWHQKYLTSQQHGSNSLRNPSHTKKRLIKVNNCDNTGGSWLIWT